MQKNCRIISQNTRNRFRSSSYSIIPCECEILQRQTLFQSALNLPIDALENTNCGQIEYFIENESFLITNALPDMCIICKLYYKCLLIINLVVDVL